MVQARSGSARLPGKIFLKLEGKSVLEHIIDFLKKSKLANMIVIATTDKSEDDKIEEIALDKKIEVFRGDADDVLSRYYNCAKKFRADGVVRITADSPLIDPGIIDKAIQIFKEKNCDFVTNMITQSFPLGYLVEVISFKTLEFLYKKIKDRETKEHVTFYLRKNPELFKTEEFFAPKDKTKPEWRLALDYPEDFQLIKEIFSKLYKSNDYIKFENVCSLLSNNKKLLEINKIRLM